MINLLFDEMYDMMGGRFVLRYVNWVGREWFVDCCCGGLCWGDILGLVLGVVIYCLFLMGNWEFVYFLLIG